jgi:hypothetical protein
MDTNKVRRIAMFTHITGKLYRTINEHKEQFPELSVVQKKISSTPIDQFQLNPFLDHLQKLGDVLKESSNSYIIRHMYFNFLKDVAAFTDNADLVSYNYYLETLE